jgi:hypothetical protein
MLEQDDRFIQRFVLAVIYFALNGHSWDLAPQPIRYAGRRSVG